MLPAKYGGESLPKPVKLYSTSCHFIDVKRFEELTVSLLRSKEFAHVVTLNPEMVLLAKKDKVFDSALQQSDIRLPDGAGLIWARWYLRSPRWSLVPSLLTFLGQSVERVTGVDAVELLARLCEAEGKKMLLVGGEASSANLTAKILRERYPKLRISVTPDHQYDEQGPKEVVESLTKEKANVILVAYGAPKQTTWIEKHREDMKEASIAMGVGGAFDIICERLPRAPLALRKRNLEWLWRLYLEPKRLARIWRAVVLFPLLMWKFSREKGSIKERYTQK